MYRQDLVTKILLVIILIISLVVAVPFLVFLIGLLLSVLFALEAYYELKEENYFKALIYVFLTLIFLPFVPLQLGKLILVSIKVVVIVWLVVQLFGKK